jgi:ethanolamine utilization protein EutM
MTALGFIETYGLLAAIEAADAMLKAAAVRLMEHSRVGAGLVTVTVSGDVAAVQAAVDAGCAAVEHLGGTLLVSRHVIARPDEELARIVPTAPLRTEAPAAENVDPDPVGDDLAASGSDLQTTPAVVAEKAASEPAGVARTADCARYELSQLKKMNVAKLRQIVRAGGLMSDEDTARAGKKDLIAAITTAHRQEEEN